MFLASHVAHSQQLQPCSQFKDPANPHSTSHLWNTHFLTPFWHSNGVKKKCVHRTASSRPKIGDIWCLKKRPNGNSVRIFVSQNDKAPAMESTALPNQDEARIPKGNPLLHLWFGYVSLWYSCNDPTEIATDWTFVIKYESLSNEAKNNSPFRNISCSEFGEVFLEWSMIDSWHE